MLFGSELDDFITGRPASFTFEQEKGFGVRMGVDFDTAAGRSMDDEHRDVNACPFPPFEQKGGRAVVET